MLVGRIQEQNQEEVDKLEKEFNDQKDFLFDNEKRLQSELDTAVKDNIELEAKLADLLSTHEKLRENMQVLTASNEQEVQLRLQFESKLNSLHALHRDLGAKYDRATEEIFNLEKINAEQNAQMVLQKNELVELRALKVENQSKISFLDERMLHMRTEIEIKN